MARITAECEARIKASTDIVELISHYLQLRRAGTSWKACCPFHNEKTPSFHVNPARQSFHCFGCGAKGDAVQFLIMYENLDYPTALRRLADMNGIQIIEEEEDREQAMRRRLRSRVIEANQLAAQYFHRKLCRDPQAAHVRAYLTKRGFNIEVAKAWQLGWAPPSSDELTRLEQASRLDTRILTEAYLLGKNAAGSTYPVFRDRLMFPIHNVRGEVVGFSGRVMEGDTDPRKYVNTAETVAFRKGELLFGLFKATRAIATAGMTVVVCEGQLDVIACHEKADIRNAVAGLGTAFTDDHAALLRKYASKAILCYDGDSAGIKASEKTYRKLAQAGLDVYMAVLPGGEDPDSLIRSQGAEALQQAIADARPYLEARVAYELQQIGTDSNARASLITRMADLAAEIANANRRDVAVVDLATRLNTGLDELRQTVSEMVRARKNTPAPRLYQKSRTDDDFPPGDEDAPDGEAVPVVAIRLHPTIRGLISLAACNKAAQDLLLEHVEELQEPIRELAGGMVLQRLLEVLPEPGNAASWKTFMQSLVPDQAAALEKLDTTVVEMPDARAAVEQACARAARDAVQARIDTLKTRIRCGDTTQQEAYRLMEECMQLQKLLNGTA